MKEKHVLLPFSILAQYVTEKCKGDRGYVIKQRFSPFQATKSNQTDQIISELEVELGPPGEVTTKVKRLRAARAYMHQYTVEP